LKEAEADAIVCGSGLSALTLACLLAHRGRKVLLLSREGEEGDPPVHCAGGFTFDTRPSLWLGGDPARPHPALAELGLAASFRPLDPGLQVVLPRHRISFYRQEVRWRQELEREFPQGQGELRSLFQVMEELGRTLGPPLENELAGRVRNLRSWWADRRSLPFRLRDLLREGKPSLSRRLQGLRDVPSRQLVESLLWGLGGAGGRGVDFSAAYAAILLRALRQPIYALAGGAKALYQALLSAFLGCGGKVLGFADPLLPLREGEVIRGLIDAEGREFRASTLFADPELYLSCRPWPGEKEGPPKGGRWPIRRLLTLFLGVDEEVLPQEMGENVLLLPEAEGRGERWPIWISLSPRDEEGRAPQGKRALTALRLLPERLDQDGGEPELEEEVSSLLRDLQGFLPFLPGGIRYQEARQTRHFSLLDPVRGWGLKMGIAPSTQIGYLGGRRFRVCPGLYLLGEFPLYGFGSRSALDTGYHWANLHAPSPGARIDGRQACRKRFWW